jgi:hypothetical protein
MDEGVWAGALPVLAPDVTVFLWGTNEQAFGTPPAAYAAALHTLVARVRAVLPHSAVVLLTPGPNDREGMPYPMTAYRDAGRDVARALNTAHIDLLTVLGEEFEIADSLGLMENGTHPNAKGGRRMAAALIEALNAVLPTAGEAPPPAPKASWVPSPNPARRGVRVVVPGAFVLYDRLGRRLADGADVLDTGRLSSGVYAVVVEGHSSWLTVVD